MRQQEFETWLERAYITRKGHVMGANARKSRVSNCRTVEEREGDLDRHYQTDQLKSLLGRLEYTTDDERKGRPAKHSIPIDGDLRTGTSTLRTAIRLYRQFCVEWPKGDPPPEFSALQEALSLSNQRRRRKSRSSWPDWPKPKESEVLQLAKLTTPFFRFIHPEILQAIVEDNEIHRTNWREQLLAREIDPDAYLWERSACAFPGIRRYAGSKEIAQYRGHVDRESRLPEQALRLDDNDYPKQIWSFIFRGSRFAKHGPIGYALAHLADHKMYKNRYAEDFDVIDSTHSSRGLFGLYTSAANTAYVPNNLIKPTDFAGPFRNLLMRKADSHYGSFCKLLPNWLRIPNENIDDEWNLESFEWAEPVGTLEHIKAFLEFRLQTIESLIQQN